MFMTERKGKLYSQTYWKWNYRWMQIHTGTVPGKIDSVPQKWSHQIS